MKAIQGCPIGGCECEDHGLRARVFELEAALKTIANYTINRPETFVHQIAIAAVPPSGTTSAKRDE